MNRLRHFIVVALVAIPFSAWADPVDRTGALCDRSLTYDAVTDATSNLLSFSEKAALNRGEQITKFLAQPNGYEMGYVFKVAGFDPELVMAVYSRSHEHAGEQGLGAFIRRSEIQGTDPENPSNPYRVFYEQSVSFPYSNGEYTMVNTISLSQKGVYAQDSVLIDSSPASFSPRWSDGYLRAYPLGSGVFVVACNYMVPRTSMWRDTFLGLARERLAESGRRLLDWVRRVAADADETQRARERLRRMLSGPSGAR